MEKDFRGTIAKCLNHFFSTFPGGKERANKIVTDFTGAKGGSLHDWINGTVPTGIRSIKLRHFLSLAGYSATEYSKVPSPIIELSKIVAYDLDSVESLADKIGVSSRALAGYFRGESNPSNDTVQIMNDVLYVVQDQIALRENAWKRTLFATPTVIAEESDIHHPGIPKDAILKSLTGQISATLQLAKLVLSDDFTPEDRGSLRKMVSNNGVFELANSLNALCSETARKLSQKGGK